MAKKQAAKRPKVKAPAKRVKPAPRLVRALAVRDHHAERSRIQHPRDEVVLRVGHAHDRDDVGRGARGDH